MRAATRVQKARSYLIERISGQGPDADGRIPPVRELAAQAGVSPVTMLKALHGMMADGHLTPTRRKRFRIASPAGLSSSVKSDHGSPHPWQRTAASISNDMLQGIFPPGEGLPSRKELQARYGVHPRTLRKAMASLATQGLLQPRGRSFAPSALPISQQSLALVAVVPYDKDGRPLTIFGEEFLRLLELRCASSRVKLVLHPYQWDGSGPVAFRDHISRTASPLPSPNDIVGYAYVAPATECGRDLVIQELTRYGKPVAVLDEEGDWLPPMLKTWGAGVRLFPMGVSLEPAREVGRYLLSLGHRSIAYLSPFHAALWSRRRAEGLADLLRTAGAGCALRTWALSAYAGHEDFQESGEAQCGIAELRRSLQRWTSAAPPACAAIATPAFEDAIATISRQGDIERRMEPLFEEAWADRSISAWVMADDYAGAIALRFLRRHRIRVPEDLSVVSFDDTAVAVQNRLTSYNFNLSAIVNAMLGHILGRAPDPRATGMPQTYIRGFVVERRTSGRPVCVTSAQGE